MNATDTSPTTSPHHGAAQSPAESIAFIEAFARINVAFIRERLNVPPGIPATALPQVPPDWDDPTLLAASGLTAAQVDAETRSGLRYLHIDVAVSAAGAPTKQLLLRYTGLSDKLQRRLYPVLSSRVVKSRDVVATEVRRLNAWLEWVRRDGFDPATFVKYQDNLGLHGATQNLSGAIGATGAAIAFVDAIRNGGKRDPVADILGDLPPDGVRSPEDIHAWQTETNASPLKALLLRNGRALVFAASRDVNIFTPLDAKFKSAGDAHERFAAVRNDRAARTQVLHEFAVGEVKTATDRANLRERIGLASRETPIEVRADRFLMMAVLDTELLKGGRQRQPANNRDVTRFNQVFNLHHCWGWDGGRARNPAHWAWFVENAKTWCGL